MLSIVGAAGSFANAAASAGKIVGKKENEKVDNEYAAKKEAIANEAKAAKEAAQAAWQAEVDKVRQNALDLQQRTIDIKNGALDIKQRQQDIKNKELDLKEKKIDDKTKEYNKKQKSKKTGETNIKVTPRVEKLNKVKEKIAKVNGTWEQAPTADIISTEPNKKNMAEYKKWLKNREGEKPAHGGFDSPEAKEAAIKSHIAQTAYQQELNKQQWSQEDLAGKDDKKKNFYNENNPMRQGFYYVWGKHTDLNGKEYEAWDVKLNPNVEDTAAKYESGEYKDYPGATLDKEKAKEVALKAISENKGE